MEKQSLALVEITKKDDMVLQHPVYSPCIISV